MTIDEIKKWMLESSGFPVTQANAEYLERFQAIAFQAGAASRDAEVARLKTVPMRYRRMAFNAQLQDEVTRLEQENDELLAQIKQKDAEITELVAALKPFGAIDLVESRLPAEFAMLMQDCAAHVGLLALAMAA